MELLPEGTYYIEDTSKLCGDTKIWWRQNGKGYTSDLTDAERWTAEDATKMLRDCPGKPFVAWPTLAVDCHAHLTVQCAHVAKVTNYNSSYVCDKN